MFSKKSILSLLIPILTILTGTVNAADTAKNIALKEGTIVYETDGIITYKAESSFFVLNIKIDSEQYELIILPNKRLEEVENTIKKTPGVTFQVTGKVYTFENRHYVLLRDVLLKQDFSDRDHPSYIPIHPSATELPENATKDSINDIVRDLERATGSLMKSIRDNAGSQKNSDGAVEGTRIHARRCYLKRNNHGSWFAVFVSDSTGLSDPPCTILPSEQFNKLIKWSKTKNYGTPVLLSGEYMNYYGHSFLVLNSWRVVHKTDSLPN